MGSIWSSRVAEPMRRPALPLPPRAAGQDHHHQHSHSSALSPTLFIVTSLTLCSSLSRFTEHVGLPRRDRTWPLLPRLGRSLRPTARPPPTAGSTSRSRSSVPICRRERRANTSYSTTRPRHHPRSGPAPSPPLRPREEPPTSPLDRAAAVQQQPRSARSRNRP